MQDTNLLTGIGYRIDSLDGLKEVAPAAFAGDHHPERTDRYSFVSTEELVNCLISNGWDLFSAKQNGKNPFSRHTVRFVNSKLGFFDLKGDKVKPQVILDNSHNGASPAQLWAGLFRLVCSNGLVVAMPGLYTNIKLKHVGINKEELKKTLTLLSDQYSLVGEHITHMQEVKMTKTERFEFAMKAIALREPGTFVKDDGTIDGDKVQKSTNIENIISPVRGEDKAENLWTVFNVVQERMVNGGYERTSFGNNRRSITKGITNAARNIEYNRILWGLAEEYMPQAEVVADVAASN
jgi:hypothetical protein